MPQGSTAPEYATQGAVEVCPRCHQQVSQYYYFCPNCGESLHAAPLSTSLPTQAWIYAFSIVLPMIAFLLITKWPGITYIRSQDQKTRQVGMIAAALLIVSTLVTFYLAWVWTNEAIQESVNQINADMSI